MKHKGHSCFNGGYAIFVSEGRFVCAGHMLMGEKHGPNAAALLSGRQNWILCFSIKTA